MWRTGRQRQNEGYKNGLIARVLSSLVARGGPIPPPARLLLGRLRPESFAFHVTHSWTVSVHLLSSPFCTPMLPPCGARHHRNSFPCSFGFFPRI